MFCLQWPEASAAGSRHQKLTEEDRKCRKQRCGQRADLVILSDNPLTIEPMKLNTIVVLETIKDGETVWQREG